ncbi:MAG: DUF4251 domain-containing protein [Bacteroidota bacterium]|nr:DUF4251 domain-containing protein [Bacteroidota bacterium]
MIKRLIPVLIAVVLAGVTLTGCGTVKTAAEKEQKALRLKEKVESSHFTFVAQSVNPMSFRTIQLTSYYDLKITKDTIRVYLPYFGRAYTAPMDPTQGGFNFMSTDFDYKMVNGKKPGNWQVTIKTHDPLHSITFYLDIWDSGMATLTINDPDRQTISFNGAIKEE